MKVNELQILQLAFQAKTDPKKCGILFKKSGKKNTISPDHNSVRWQERWCVVYYNLFFYYESKTSVKPQGVIFLECVNIEQLQIKDSSNSYFCIGIPGEEPHRHYLFRCSSDIDCNEWLQAIQDGSGHSLHERNNNLVNTILDLESHIDSLKDEKEKLRQELSDSYTQVSRLKRELSSVRNQAESVRSSNLQRKSSFVEPIKFDDTGIYSGTSLSDKEYSAEDVTKLVKLQSHIRSWLLQRRWRGLTKSYVATFGVEKLKQRNKLLWQFITAEEDYVRQMKVLVNVFLTPMKQTSVTQHPSISKSEVVKIFTNSESILVLHKIFVEGMATRMKDWPAVHIDDLLFAIVAAVPIYIEYIKNHPEALETLAECKKRPGFVKLLTWCEGKDDCHGQTLEQFLLYPVRVMPTYVRNIYEILEETPDDHIERKSLESILFKLQEAQSYNHYLDEGESIRHTLEIERLIDGGCHTLLEPNQKFIRHGVLKQVNIEPNFPSGRRDKIRHCFLFSQHLIIASRTADGRLRLSKQSGEIPLANTTLVEEGTDTKFSDYMKSISFTLNVNTALDSPVEKQFTVILKASKSSEKNLWTTDISQCIYNLALENDVATDSSYVVDDDSNTATATSTDDAPKESPTAPSPTAKPYSLPHIEDPRLRENDVDILYSGELSGPYHLPQIMYASVDRLIERLVDPRLPGAEFMETFLLTYRSFTTSEVTINGLIEAYWKVMGGPPSQKKKTDSPERKKLAVSKSVSSGRRHRTTSSVSDASSDIDLEGSFNSNVSPYASTTVFNYNTLKDQLNSPTKRKLATTKWCEDSAAAAAKENGSLAHQKLRSTSACNISSDNLNVTTRKMSRSQSVEVLVRKDTSDTDVNSNTKNGSLKPHEFISAYDSRSCDQLGDPASFHDENKIHIIISVPTEGIHQSSEIPKSNGHCDRPGVDNKDATSVLTDDNTDNEEMTPPRRRHRGSLLSEEISASEGIFLNGVEKDTIKPPTDEDIDTTTADSMTTDSMTTVSMTTASMTRTDTDMSTSFTNSDLSNSYMNGGESSSSFVHQGGFMESFRNRQPSSSFTDHEMSPTSFTNDDEVSRFCTNEDITINTLSTRPRNGGLFENVELIDGETTSDIVEEVVDAHGKLRNRSSIAEDAGSLSLNSTLSDNCFTERSNTIDSSYTSEGDRRSTMESQNGDPLDNTSSRYLDVYSLDRSTTMDSMNSFASSDVSMNDRSVDGESVTSRSNSHSDETINMKSRSGSEIVLQAKSSSLGEKKSSLTPFRRRKKDKDKKEKEELKKYRTSSVSKDEPVLISIREKSEGGRVILERSQSHYQEKTPIETFPIDPPKPLEPERKSIEQASIPIPVPTLKQNKLSADGTPRRKRSLFLSPFRKNPMKRASSEQNILVRSNASNGMKPAMSQMNLQPNESVATRHSPVDLHNCDSNSLDRKKLSSFRNKLNSLTSSELDLSTKGSLDNKGTLKKEKKRAKGSVKRNNILSSTTKSPAEVSAPRRKTSMGDHLRPKMITRKSVSVNRGPLKIMSIFKHWLAKHPKDFVMDPAMLKVLEKFFTEIKNDDRTLPVVKEIVGSLEKSLNVHRQSLAAVHPFDELLLQQHSLRNVQATDICEQDELNRCTEIHNYPPAVVAGSMTLLEHYLYAKISFNEFVSCQWTKKDKDKKAPGIMKFIKRFNQVTSIISYGVVHGETPEKRAALIEFWIRTAAHCRDLNNFNAIVEIISALNASAVHRLKKSWELVSRPYRDVFCDLDALVSADRAFKNLREAVHMCNPPCVPYLGCYLSDLLFAHEGGKTFNENGLVNHAKMCRVSRLVREVKCYQQLPYTIELNKEVAHSLVNWDVDVDLDLLYDQSLIAEPRGS